MDLYGMLVHHRVDDGSDDEEPRNKELYAKALRALDLVSSQPLI
jgi:hypothetical protein